MARPRRRPEAVWRVRGGGQRRCGASEEAAGGGATRDDALVGRDGVAEVVDEVEREVAHDPDEAREELVELVRVRVVRARGRADAVLALNVLVHLRGWIAARAGVPRITTSRPARRRA